MTRGEGREPELRISDLPPKTPRARQNDDLRTQGSTRSVPPLRTCPKQNRTTAPPARMLQMCDGPANGPHLRQALQSARASASTIGRTARTPSECSWERSRQNAHCSRRLTVRQGLPEHEDPLVQARELSHKEARTATVGTATQLVEVHWGVVKTHGNPSDPWRRIALIETLGVVASNDVRSAVIVVAEHQFPRTTTVPGKAKAAHWPGALPGLHCT